MLQKEREVRNKLIIADYETGLRISDVAEKYKFAKSNIARILKEADVWVRGRDGHRKRETYNTRKKPVPKCYSLSGKHIEPHIRALYDPKNIITKECLSHSVTSRRVE